MLPLAFKPLSLIALLLLAAGLLGCAADRESVPPPTKAAPTLVGESQGNRSTPTTPGSLKHPNLDTYLNQVVADGRAPERYYVNDGFIPDKSVGVSIDLSGNAETVAAWLESEGISRRETDGNDEVSPCRLGVSNYCIVSRGDADRITAYLPLDLLSPLSRQPGVAHVRAVNPYPKLSRSLRELAVKFDGPMELIWGNNPRTELRPATQEVYICSSEQTTSITAWLESEGVYAHQPELTWDPVTTGRLHRLATRVAGRRDTVAADPVDPLLASPLATLVAPQPEPRYDTLIATMPVSLLGNLSLRQGVYRVHRGGFCEGIEEIGSRGSPCYNPEGCEPPFAVIDGLGNTETFLLFTNIARPPGVRVSVNSPEDTGKLAIGSCLDGSDSTFVGHADSVTIAGCSAGDAQVRLSLDGELLESYDLRVISLLNR